MLVPLPMPSIDVFDTLPTIGIWGGRNRDAPTRARLESSRCAQQKMLVEGTGAAEALLP